MIAIGKIGTKIFESRLLGIIESKMWELTPWAIRILVFRIFQEGIKR